MEPRPAAPAPWIAALALDLSVGIPFVKTARIAKAARRTAASALPVVEMAFAMARKIAPHAPRIAAIALDQCVEMGSVQRRKTAPDVLEIAERVHLNVVMGPAMAQRPAIPAPETAVSVLLLAEMAPVMGLKIASHALWIVERVHLRVVMEIVKAVRHARTARGIVALVLLSVETEIAKAMNPAKRVRETVEPARENAERINSPVMMENAFLTSGYATILSTAPMGRMSLKRPVVPA